MNSFRQWLGQTPGVLWGAGVAAVAASGVYFVRLKPSQPGPVAAPTAAPAFAVAATRIPITLPISAATNLQLPPRGWGSVDSNLNAVGPPVHPTGTLSNLMLFGKEIPLTSPDIRNGFLSTAGFGDWEVLASYSGGGIELRAFPADIEKLKNAYPAP